MLVPIITNNEKIILLLFGMFTKYSLFICHGYCKTKKNLEKKWLYYFFTPVFQVFFIFVLVDFFIDLALVFTILRFFVIFFDFSKHNFPQNHSFAEKIYRNIQFCGSKISKFIFFCTLDDLT